MSAAGGILDVLGCVTAEGKPFVVTIVNGSPFGQLTPFEAQQLGTRIIQASIEAERDCAVVRHLKAEGRSDEEIGAELTKVREWRDQADPDPDQSVVSKKPH
jgi:hypothetical protein